MAEGDGHQWVHAFKHSIGGEPISASRAVGSYVFLNNSAGWHILPPDVDGELRILGNLYPNDPDIAVFHPRPNRTMSPILDRAAAAQTSSVGISAIEVNAISDAVWANPIADRVRSTLSAILGLIFTRKENSS